MQIGSRCILGLPYCQMLPVTLVPAQADSTLGRSSLHLFMIASGQSHVAIVTIQTIAQRAPCKLPIRMGLHVMRLEDVQKRKPPQRIALFLRHTLGNQQIPVPLLPAFVQVRQPLLPITHRQERIQRGRKFQRPFRPLVRILRQRRIEVDIVDSSRREDDMAVLVINVAPFRPKLYDPLFSKIAHQDGPPEHPEGIVSDGNHHQQS